MTRAEVLAKVRAEIFRSGLTYREIAVRCGRSPATIGALANGTTRWPRPETLFPLITALGLTLELR